MVYLLLFHSAKRHSVVTVTWDAAVSAHHHRLTQLNKTYATQINLDHATLRNSDNVMQLLHLNVIHAISWSIPTYLDALFRQHVLADKL